MDKGADPACDQGAALAMEGLEAVPKCVQRRAAAVRRRTRRHLQGWRSSSSECGAQRLVSFSHGNRQVIVARQGFVRRNGRSVVSDSPLNPLSERPMLRFLLLPVSASQRTPDRLLGDLAAQSGIAG